MGRVPLIVFPKARIPSVVRFAFAAIWRVCFLKDRVRSNQMPSQQVAPPLPGGLPRGVVHCGFRPEWALVKCWSSVFVKSKVSPCVVPQLFRSWAIWLRFSVLSSRLLLATSWQMPSAYPKRPCWKWVGPIWNSGWVKSMNKMGDTGEPCGSPAGIWKSWLWKLSSRRDAERF